VNIAAVFPSAYAKVHFVLKIFALILNTKKNAA
jgi:hypothetical protein